MKIILMAFKLFFLGIYIDITRYFLNIALKNKKADFTSKKLVFLSSVCNIASLSFTKTELRLKKIADL